MNNNCEFCETNFATKYNLQKHQRRERYCLALRSKQNGDEVSCTGCKKNYTSKPQPGIFAKIPKVKRNKREYRCKNFIDRVLADYPKSQFISTSEYKNGKR